mmetsp:Transcript_10562/g.42630  ORF Transcript_10562/g.42630 Transcript_10562/m.42630 type:complete len:110 (+) Transcript_10562:1278-1607(+)
MTLSKQVEYIIESKNPAKMAKHKGEPWGPMKIGLGIAFGMFGGPKSEERDGRPQRELEPLQRGPIPYDEYRKTLKNGVHLSASPEKCPPDPRDPREFNASTSDDDEQEA